jgi:hypothetical protein
MDKKSMLLAGLMTGFALVAGLPSTLWAKGQPMDRHDCHRVKSGYVCEKGPLAGRSFASRQAMINALRKDIGPGNVQPVRDQPSVKKKPSKAKASQ